MATGTLELIDGGNTGSAATLDSVSSGHASETLLNLPAMEFPAEREQGNGLGCAFAVRLAIVVELLTAMVIYGAWKLIH